VSQVVEKGNTLKRGGPGQIIGWSRVTLLEACLTPRQPKYVKNHQGNIGNFRRTMNSFRKSGLPFNMQFRNGQDGEYTFHGILREFTGEGLVFKNKERVLYGTWMSREPVRSGSRKVTADAKSNTKKELRGIKAASI